MNTKTSWIALALLILAILFVPIIPNDAIGDCGDHGEDCDMIAPYTSVYQKYFAK